MQEILHSLLDGRPQVKEQLIEEGQLVGDRKCGYRGGTRMIGDRKLSLRRAPPRVTTSAVGLRWVGG